ncbi:MAG TPA: lipoyl(octanoyl) transferase LipB [Geopsychrobacteraceae bacterium]|nr:lipoyl(octanoyl) transferase LipB [Geopsychrobacteraceae bacterium]
MPNSNLNKTSTQPRQGRLIVRQLGLQPYEPVWQRMQQFTAQRNNQTFDEIWLLEHERVFTQGRSGKSEHILAAGDIPVVQVDRGGQVTYHGPGQLIIYLMIDLKRCGLMVRSLVTLTEQSIIDALADCGIKAETRAKAPGVYVDGAKIASLGFRVQRGCSFHGLSLNLDLDLEPFLRINPCGYHGLQMTCLKDLLGKDRRIGVTEKLTELLVTKLGYTSVVKTDGWD